MKHVRRHAVRALLLVARWWGLGLGVARRSHRNGHAAEFDVLRERVGRLEAENDLLRGRLRKMPSRSRPHYSAWQRLAILWHGARHGLSTRALAKIFVVSPTTIARWLEDVFDGVRRLVRGREPMNKLTHVIREVVARLKAERPDWGTRRLSGLLARLGLAGSRASVQRMLRRRPPRPAQLAKVVKPKPKRRGIRPKHSGHAYFIDFTTIRALGLFTLTIGAVIDGFSRRVLALQAWKLTPTAADARELLEAAIRAGGRPRHLVSDHGVQFTARLFTGFLRRRRIHHRYGAVGKSQSVAIIDRFFGSLKREFATPMLVFKKLARVRSALASYTRWYNTERPHWSLQGQTPIEVFAGRQARKRHNPKKPARYVLSVDHVDGLRSLQVFRLRRAA